MKRFIISLSFLCFGVHTAIADETPLEAHFTAQEASVPYYKMGWDSADEAATWTYSGVASGYLSWHLEENTPYIGQPPFSSIDPDSKYSLCVRYGSSAQNEVATSPTIAILPNTTLEFYACFRSVYLVFADWKFIITDQDTSETLMEWSAFLWSQQNGFTGPTWQKITFDLSEYADKHLTFAFRYMGPDGEDLAIDGFRLYQNIDDPDATITIDEGGLVHFLDTSTGNPTQWLWTFEGGTPATSTEQHPVVSYNTAGSYTVSLTCSTDNGAVASTITREGYVNVVAQAPQALIGLPDEGYLSPWTALFIPTDTPIVFHDLSSGLPTTWHWTFPGGIPEESDEQNPTVVYHEEGVYGLTLDVSNAAGTSNDFLANAIQVGGTQYVWNIGLDEYEQMGEINFGLYGYYGGTNWLNIEKFAEHFKAPQAPATIDRVQVYFYSTTAATTDAEITVSLCMVGSDGNPADVLASASVRAGELAYDPEEIVPTDFIFDRPVSIDQPFFIVIGPFPHNDGDAISILAVKRDEGETSTTWHLLEDEDPITFEPLGTYQWFENTDSPVSLCITPQLSYAPMPVTNIDSPMRHPLPQSSIYDLQGRRIEQIKKGIYIRNGKKIVVR